MFAYVPHRSADDVRRAFHTSHKQVKPSSFPRKPPHKMCGFHAHLGFTQGCKSAGSVAAFCCSLSLYSVDSNAVKAGLLGRERLYVYLLLKFIFGRHGCPRQLIGVFCAIGVM